MKLNRLSERVWFFPYEEERDRPNLGYVRGDRWSLAVDAGHSEAHVKEFYKALEEEGMPLPGLTVLTHWHWDHTFGMHAVHGLCLANERTNRHLREAREKLRREGPEAFLSLDESIRAEYAGNRSMVITEADLVFSGEILLDLGNCPVRVFQAEAPHTDDSSLVYLPEEKVLFLGDASCGTFPDWKKDAALCRQLAQTVKTLGAETVLEGHWTPVPVQDTINDLLSDIQESE